MDYTCCEVIGINNSEEDTCFSFTTPTKTYGGALQPWQFVLTEADFAVDCRSNVLQSVTFNFNDANELAIVYDCCKAVSVEDQTAGIASIAYQPQDGAPTANTGTPNEVRRVEVKSVKESDNTPLSEVSFILDGDLWNNSRLSGLQRRMILCHVMSSPDMKS